MVRGVVFFVDRDGQAVSVVGDCVVFELRAGRVED